MTEASFPLLTPAAFDELIAQHKLRSTKLVAACRRVLVDGVSRYAAAQEAGLNYAPMHRAIRKLQGVCPCCGRPLPPA